MLGPAALALATLLASAPPPAPTRVEKMAHVLSLEDRRTLGSGELLRLLADGDAGVRRRAALAAGRIADPAAVSAVANLIGDAEPEVRQMAAFALGLIGDRSAAPRLLAALDDRESVVRARALEAIGRLGDAALAPEVAKRVLAAMPPAPALTVRGDDPGSAADPWLELRLGLFALARLKDAKVAASVLLNDGKPRFDWWAATWTAMRLESPLLRPLLLAGAGSSDPLSRAFAARGLGALKDPADLELLGRLARDPDPTVAVTAIRAVAALGDARGGPILARALRSEDPTLLREALSAVASLPTDPSVRDLVMGLVAHREPWVRGPALRALARVDPQDFPLVLSGLDPDPVWTVRADLALALADIKTELCTGILLGLLKDEDARVLPTVLEAIEKARGANAVPTLRQHLQHPDVAVRATAAELLGKLKPAGISAELAGAYRQALGDADLDFRSALLGALQAQADEVAKTALREAAQADPARVVRERAGAALKELGETAPAPGPDAVQRPLADYRELMAPYDPQAGAVYTPRAFVHTARGTIEIHLNVVEAPIACASFLDLARRGFYDGLTFHRVVPGFVIQGGCPRGDGNGGPGFTLRCEVGEKPYGRGVVGMALSGKDTGGSQFFITHLPTPHLDGGYAVLGWVAKGMEVVDQIRPGDVIESVEVFDGR